MGLRELPVPPEIRKRIKDNLESGCFEIAKSGITEEGEVCICNRCGHLSTYTLIPGRWYEHNTWKDLTTGLWNCIGAIDLEL